MGFWDLVGVWIAAFLTLSILSFLYKDNPFYKFAEHLFVGVSAAYGIVTAINMAVWPALRDSWAFPGAAKLGLIFSIILGILYLFRLEITSTALPNLRWLARYPIAFTVGVWTGISIIQSIHSYFFPQLQATFLPLFKIRGASPLDILNNWLIVIVVVFVFLYFFFSAKYSGRNRWILRTGITFLMVAFGAMFGYTVMARLSLLIGRVYFLLYDWIRLDWWMRLLGIGG